MLFLSFLRVLMMLIAGPEEAKNPAGRGVLRLIQIRLPTPSFGKIRRICQDRKRGVTSTSDKAPSVSAVIQNLAMPLCLPQVRQKNVRAGFCPELRLTSCSVFRQTASMEAEIDCTLQSNPSWVYEVTRLCRSATRLCQRPRK